MYVLQLYSLWTEVHIDTIKQTEWGTFWPCHFLMVDCFQEEHVGFVCSFFWLFIFILDFSLTVIINITYLFIYLFIYSVILHLESCLLLIHLSQCLFPSPLSRIWSPGLCFHHGTSTLFRISTPSIIKNCLWRVSITVKSFNNSPCSTCSGTHMETELHICYICAICHDAASLCFLIGDQSLIVSNGPG